MPGAENRPANDRHLEPGMTLKRDWIPSPNYSSRGGSGVRLVVVHTAEGPLTYDALGNYFDNPSVQASSHVGIDSTPGRIGEYVKRGNKAWTQGNANPYSVAVELCGFAAWTPDQWRAHPVMLDNCARWIAEECAHFGIPIRKLSSGQAQSGDRGVCGHVDISGVGGHWDPGPNFPYSRVLQAAISGGPVYDDDQPTEPIEIHPAGLPIAILGGLDDMAVEYLIEDTSKENPGSGNVYACYSSGLVRLTSKGERDYLAGHGAPQTIRINMSTEVSNRYRDLDRALRGYIEKRG